MDEKTERLRDIFLSVSEDAELTERQSAARGSLAAEGASDEAVTDVVATMRERYEFATDLDDAALCTVARGFYAGESDAAIGRALGDVGAGTVRRARLDLHLVTDRDLDPPFDLDELRHLRDTGVTYVEMADALGVSESTVRRYARALDVQQRRRLVGDRFREELDRLLGDGELSAQLTAAIRETGLGDATEDVETNTSF